MSVRAVLDAHEAFDAAQRDGAEPCWVQGNPDEHPALAILEHRTHAHAADVESGAHDHAVGVWRANAGTALRVERNAVYAGDGQDVRGVRHAGVDRVAARV